VNDSRRLVYVSGAPGSGKTSLAVPLAAELGYALLAKDRIKETLHDALGAPQPDRAWSRKLGGAAMELLWALAADAPAAVIEANFRPYSQYERARLSGLAAQPVEVHCACPPELAVKRYNARATHPVHVVRQTLSIIMQEPYKISQFARHLSALSEKDRGPILRKEKRYQQIQYRFIDPLVQPYITMRGLRDGMIDSFILKYLEDL